MLVQLALWLAAPHDNRVVSMVSQLLTSQGGHFREGVAALLLLIRSKGDVKPAELFT